MSQASVFLADDHEEFLAVVRRLLEPEFEVVETVRDGLAAVEAAARLTPDVAGARPFDALDGRDRGGPVPAGVRLAGEVRLPDCPWRPRLCPRGPRGRRLGYVVKCRLASDLLPALREALAGRPFVSPSIRLERSGPLDPSAAPAAVPETPVRPGPAGHWPAAFVMSSPRDCYFFPPPCQS